MKKFNKITITAIVTLTVASTAFIGHISPSTVTTFGTVTVGDTVSENEGTNIAVSGLNVRSEANTKSKILGTLPNHEKIKLLGKTGDFYKIKYNKSFGYIAAKYVRLAELSPKVADKAATKPKDPEKAESKAKDSAKVENKSKEAAAPIGIQVAIVSSSIGANVRSSANSASTKLGFLLDKSSVEILGKSADWYKIKYNKGEGYVFSKYIKITTPVNQPPTSSQNKN